MIPLDRDLTDQQLSEVLTQIRRATRSATTAMARIAISEARPGVVNVYTNAGLEPIGPDLFRAPGNDESARPIYLSHSTADNDAAIIRPLGWRNPSGSSELFRKLLSDIASLPSGGYALARVDDRDLVFFVDHLATQRLDSSEVETSLASARFAGALQGVETYAEELAPGTPSKVGDAVEAFLLQRPGWMRPARDDAAGRAWIHNGKVQIAAYLDEERGLLVMARDLRSFLGNVPLDVTERLLRGNRGLLDGAIATVRDGSRGALVILQRLCLQDLDDVELERSVAYLERVKIPWARGGRAALELLGMLERARRPLRRESTVQTAMPVEPVRQWPETVSLGTCDSNEALRLPVSDLLTHMFVCGGSGSGKTVVCKGLLEELAMAGVPSLVIDLKGDLSSLACVPTATEANAIAEYLYALYGDAAPMHKGEIAQTASTVAAFYADAGFDDTSLSEFRKYVQVRILTPRSDAAIPLALSPLSKIELGAIGESAGIIGNRDLHELVDSNLRSLVEHLDLSGGDTENLVAVLTQLLETAHRRGLPLQGIEGIEAIVRLLFEVGEHTETINFLPTDWAIEEKQARRYAQTMNARLGGTFRYWFDGEPLSVDDLISTSDGRVPINVINLSMLPNTSDQAYAIAQVNAQIIEWMRRQPGSQRPRLAYFIDEIAQDGGKGAIFPPYPSNPVTKPGLTVLLKQGRAFGVSCILATQNAKDIDYKGLGQIDTWIMGRLKTAMDIERLKLGIEAAQVEATHSFEDQATDMLKRVAGLAPGSFVIKTRSNGVKSYRQRWIRSLHERMTPEMIRQWARAEELAVDREIEAAQELWNQGRAEEAVEQLEAVIARSPYYTRVAEARLVLCEWLFRSESWGRVAEYTGALRATVQSRSGFELVHYYEGLANLELGNLVQARAALERFVASAAGSSGPLGERCREHLQDLFVQQDDYESLEETAAAGAANGGSKLMGFCRAMRNALTNWPALKGNLDGATVIEHTESAERLHFARKVEGARTVQAYAAEIQRRLGDLDLSPPEVSPLSERESAELRQIAERISLDEEERRSREEQLAESLAEAERLIDGCDFASASEAIDVAKKLVRSAGEGFEDLDRVISLYRGATSAGRRSIADWLLGLDPYQFELETAALFRSLGYDAQVTKASGDGGVDVFAEYRNRRYVIQCKRYRHPVSPGVIRELATTVRNFDADEAILVATTRFSEGCQEEADRHDIRLIGLDELLALYGARDKRRHDEGAASQRDGRQTKPPSHRDGLEAELADAVLDCLEAAGEPLLVGAIAERSGWPADRCRTALHRLMGDGKVGKAGQRRGTRYFVRR